MKKRLQRRQRQQEQLMGEGLELAQYGNYGKGAFHSGQEDPEQEQRRREAYQQKKRAGEQDAIYKEMQNTKDQTKKDARKQKRELAKKKLARRASKMQKGLEENIDKMEKAKIVEVSEQE